MQQWFAAYLLTCAVEIPIVVAMLHGLGWRSPGRHPDAKAALVAWLLQFTNPLLWLIGPGSWAGLLAAEALIVLVEGAALYYWALLRTCRDEQPSTHVDKPESANLHMLRVVTQERIRGGATPHARPRSKPVHSHELRPNQATLGWCLLIGFTANAASVLAGLLVVLAVSWWGR